MTVVWRDLAREERATPDVTRMGDYVARLYSDTGGLTRFGAFVETLAPGARSSDRHWHEAEDEFVYLIEGTAVLVEDDGPHEMRAGDAACWKAGVANGHHLINRSGRPCTYLVVGTRSPADRVHFSDLDKVYSRRADGTVTRTRRDGSPLEEA